jgi:hypothetical protein
MLVLPGTNAKLKNKSINYEQMTIDAGQAGTEDSERSNVHCFNVPPVFWQVVCCAFCPGFF